MIIGAHPDDIEIAAGGTTARLTARGADVVAVVASDETDPDVATLRRAEACTGLGLLGVEPDRIEFLGLPDREVDADTGAARLRRLVHDIGMEPDVVITHSCHDDHSDHRAVAVMTEAVFAGSVAMLAMSVVNSARATFRPSVFVDTSDQEPAKLAALSAHRSQAERGRIRLNEIAAVESAYAATTGGSRAEGFELRNHRGRLDDRITRWLVPCVTFDADHPRTRQTRHVDTSLRRSHTPADRQPRDPA